jgi:serine/threonine protein kinase
VYKAKNVRTGTLAAVKAVSADKVAQQKMLDSLMSEINILRTVVHPNIVKLLDYVQRQVRCVSKSFLNWLPALCS